MQLTSYPPPSTSSPNHTTPPISYSTIKSTSLLNLILITITTISLLSTHSIYATAIIPISTCYPSVSTTFKLLSTLIISTTTHPFSYLTLSHNVSISTSPITNPNYYIAIVT